MTQIADPYPAKLEDLDTEPITVNQDAVTNRLIVAINRLAIAIENQNRAQNAPQAPQSMPVAATSTVAPLVPLPPVQTVADKPSCPRHGPEKVAPSNQFQGFYCQAKARPGEPMNRNGFCTWQVRQ